MILFVCVKATRVVQAIFSGSYEQDYYQIVVRLAVTCDIHKLPDLHN